MFRQSRVIGAAAAVVLCAACSKQQTAGTAGAAASPAVSLRPSEARWTGTILPTSQNSGQAFGSRRTQINGQVTMVADRDYPNRTAIDISIGTPASNSSVLWALVPERCGTNGAPVLSINSFSPIEVGPSGRGEVKVVIPFELPTQGAYHVDVYEGRRATLADVQACAEMKLLAK